LLKSHWPPKQSHPAGAHYDWNANAGYSYYSISFDLSINVFVCYSILLFLRFTLTGIGTLQIFHDKDDC